MTHHALAMRLARLRPRGPVSDRLMRIAAGRFGTKNVWYETQQQHWLGWLSEYGGAGAYGRKRRGIAPARFVYTHFK